MPTQLNMTRDIAGDPTYGVAFTADNYQVALEAGTEKTLTVPVTAGNWQVLFSMEPGSEVWIALNETATLPALPGGEFVATYSQLNPMVRAVKAGDVLHFITGNVDAKVGVSFYV